MNKYLKVLLCVVVVVVLLGLLALVISKSIKPYDPDDFIGLTSEQIVERYGKFDIRRFWDSEAGCYRACGYTVKPKRVGYLGTDPEEYFMIHFDENAIAYECTYETGGWGG